MARLRDGEEGRDVEPVTKRKKRAFDEATKPKEDEFKSAFFTEEEVENAKLTLKHGLPSSLVRELQSKGQIKYGEGRVILSTTISLATANAIQELCQVTGLTRGKLIDRVVWALQHPREDEGQPNKLDRLARRKKP